jgi:endonuclease YncB( thermonuclease family)
MKMIKKYLKEKIVFRIIRSKDKINRIYKKIFNNRNFNIWMIKINIYSSNNKW